MKFKVLVKIFAIALIIISLYQLSITYVVHRYENKVGAQAQQYVNNRFPSPQQVYPNNKEEQAFYKDSLQQVVKSRVQEIEDSSADDIVYNSLIQKFTYQKAKANELNLGLDLQGGMNVVLEVSLEDLIHSMANNSKDPAFNKALALATQRKANSSADYVTLFGDAYAEVAPNGRLAPIFANQFSKNLTYNSSNTAVLKEVRAQADDAISRTYEVLRNRIDQFGVAQPNINLDKTKGIITVELAGYNNPERVRNYLQATANLEFWETFAPDQDFQNNILVPMDKTIAQYLSVKNAGEDTSGAQALAATDTAAKAQQDTSSFGSLGQYLNKSNNPKAGATDTGNLAELTASETQNPLFSILKPASVRSAVASISPHDTAKFNRYIHLDAVRGVLPQNLKFLYGADLKNTNGAANNDNLDIYAIKTVSGSDQPMLDGQHVVNARQDFDQNGNAEISMEMDQVGARIWQKMTGANVGKSIAIVLDNHVYSAPNVEGEISGGRSSITGNFTVQEAQDLSNILKAGKLPAPARIVQEQVIGPTLGRESITAGAKSFALSFVVIFILMLIYYNTGGVVADIALILNLLFTVGVLAALGATLTMPGIAGLILTIGMAVDTNVIIFERIKEELTRGKSYLLSVEDGYRRSYAPVIDAQVTTLLTAIILFYFGLGPVKGFATTQILGILLSLFCGILVSRLITDYWTNKNRHFKYFTPLSRRIFQHAQYKFIENRKYAYIISALVLIFGVASLIHGFEKGVEFAGGRSYTVRFDHPVKVANIRESLNPVFNEFPEVKTIGSDNQVNITTSFLIKQTGRNIDSIVESKLYAGLKSYLPVGTTYQLFEKNNLLSSQTVLPTISDDLKKGAIKATIFALLAIFLYVLIRFRKWQYSIGTIVALLHDVMVILIVFSLLRGFLPFSMAIGQDFIAAVLTVIGYSMNDTVIVFDRVREYFREMKGADRTTVINKAINDTLSRTVMTSLTVFLTILILFIFGGESTRGFAFAMLIGVITGTYSSIFVAAPVLIDFDKKNSLGTTESMSKGKVIKKPAAKKQETTVR